MRDWKYVLFLISFSLIMFFPRMAFSIADEAIAEEEIRIQQREQILPSRASMTITMLVTGYTTDPRECGREPENPHYGKTASGYPLTQADAYKVVAVDNNLIKFGTKMIIHDRDRDYLVIAKDTGGDIKGGRLDLFIGYVTKEENDLRRATGQEPRAVLEAFKWGTRTLKVTILKE